MSSVLNSPYPLFFLGIVIFITGIVWVVNGLTGLRKVEIDSKKFHYVLSIARGLGFIILGLGASYSSMKLIW